MLPPEIGPADNLRRQSPELMQKIAEQSPDEVYEALYEHYQRVRGDHHLLEPAYRALCEQLITEEMPAESAGKLAALKRQRRSAMHLVPFTFRQEVDIDYPPEIG